MKSVLALRHMPHEPLGAVEQYFAEAGLKHRYIDLFDSLPEQLDLDNAAALVVLGGPMNVDQVQQYPHLSHEVRWIQQALQKQIPMLGICLGAQLLAKALGARVYANGVKEIGWYGLEMLSDAQADPLFAGCKPQETVFQWHGDTFDLPQGAVWLARSPRCKHQAFRWGASAWGLQFHIEMTQPMIDNWLSEPDMSCEVQALDYIDPAQIRGSTAECLPRMQQLGRLVLARFAAMARGRACAS